MDEQIWPNDFNGGDNYDEIDRTTYHGSDEMFDEAETVEPGILTFDYVRSRIKRK